MDYKITCYSGL